MPLRYSAKRSSPCSDSSARCHSAMLPRPPHWASSTPPGRRAAIRRSNSRSWSRIQWKVALEKIASTGSESSSSEQIGDDQLDPVAEVGEVLGRVLDHRRRAVDPDHPAVAAGARRSDG